MCLYQVVDVMFLHASINICWRFVKFRPDRCSLGGDPAERQAAFHNISSGKRPVRDRGDHRPTMSSTTHNKACAHAKNLP